VPPQEEYVPQAE
jgi:sorting nexin-1/2